MPEKATASLLLLSELQKNEFFRSQSQEQLRDLILEHSKRANLPQFIQEMELMQLPISVSTCAHITIAAEIFTFMQVGIHWIEKLEYSQAIPYILLAINP